MYFVAETLNGLSHFQKSLEDLLDFGAKHEMSQCRMCFFFESKSWNFDYILKSKVNNPCLMLLTQSALKMEK